MPNLKPTFLVDRFIKSATLGKKYTQKTKRLLTVFIFPIWTVGFIISVITFYQGVTAISDYKEKKHIIETIQQLKESTNQLNDQLQSEGVLKTGETLRFDENRAWENYWEAKYEVGKLYYVLWYVLICFVFPWLLLRLIFWIKNADNAEKI